MDRIKHLLGLTPEEEREPEDDSTNVVLLHEEQKQQLEYDLSILEEKDSELEKRVQEAADQTVVSAAEDSLKRLHVIQKGRCPECGDHLSRHLFATICESCGWNEFDTPRKGPVHVHLKNVLEPIKGDRAYLVKNGSVLVVKDEVVIARINKDVVGWIEYQWPKAEIDTRRRQVADQLTVFCGWCRKACDVDADGFHMVQIAFGSTQERHTFCSDECYDAFRKMYPARVDRDCYERNCSDCQFCVKRYDDETDAIHFLGKDYLKVRNQTK